MKPAILPTQLSNGSWHAGSIRRVHTLRGRGLGGTPFAHRLEVVCFRAEDIQVVGVTDTSLSRPPGSVPFARAGAGWQGLQVDRPGHDVHADAGSVLTPGGCARRPRGLASKDQRLGKLEALVIHSDTVDAIGQAPVGVCPDARHGRVTAQEFLV